MSHKIYAPNVHLFAFHDSHKRSSDSSHLNALYDEDLLWRKGNAILRKFQINQELNIKKHSDWGRFSLLEDATDSNIFLPLTGKINHQEQYYRITGCTCPLQIEDSYALALNLRIPEFSEEGKKTDEVDLTIFKAFNPDQCFSSQTINSSLGQTLLLTAWLSQKEWQSKKRWQEIADECVQNFLGEDRDKCPPLYQVSQLFGSPIFEYGNPYQPQGCDRILVWLFIREAFNDKNNSRLDNNFGFFYQKFIDLCLYRQKAINDYQLSLQVYEDIQQKNQAVNNIISKIAELSKENHSSTEPYRVQSLSEASMSYFKNKLGILPKLASDCTEGIKALEGYYLTIEAHTKTYAERIRQIQERLPSYDLSFLSIFHQKTSSSFLANIKAKISDGAYGSSLVEKAIASIRGLVEIDKVQRDRTLEASLRANEIAAQEREKKLQIWIALVVACLAISGIFSQVASPAQSIFAYLNSMKSSMSPLSSFANLFLSNFLNLLLQTILGLAVALLLGLILWLIPKQANDSSISKD